MDTSYILSTIFDINDVIPVILFIFIIMMLILLILHHLKDKSSQIKLLDLQDSIINNRIQIEKTYELLKQLFIHTTDIKNELIKIITDYNTSRVSKINKLNKNNKEFNTK